MELKIKNFAKIKEADFDFKGITVIAGENNSGKSTVGKILFTLFNGYNNIQEEIRNNRWREIARRTFQLIGNAFEDESIISNRRVLEVQLKKHNPRTIEKCKDLVLDYLQKSNILTQDIFDSLKLDIKKNIEKIYTYSDTQIRNGILSKSFENVFSKQANSLRNTNNAQIDLKIKNKWTRVILQKETCMETTESNINHEAVYIDDPFIIDSVEEFFRTFNKSPMISALKRKLKVRSVNIDKNNVLANIIKTEQIQEVTNQLGRVLNGSFVTNENGLAIHSEKLQKDILVSNISAGLKVFAILKRLLETNNLNEQDVLILDEPEIHLHPEWQLIYAELIVLLQKTFDLTVLLTTHSPYFLEAIEVYAKLHDVEDKVTYYLSQQKNDEVTFEDVTDNTSKVYQKLLEPFEKLEQLRLKLGMDE